MEYKKVPWLRFAFQLKGSVIPSVMPQVIWCSLFALLISVLFYYKIPIAQKILGNVIPSVVLGLLLVFRTNTAYERFWEGRKIWGTIVNTTRNLARLIWVSIDDDYAEQKKAVVKLLPAFAIATKLHVRSVVSNDELKDLLSTVQYEKIQTVSNRPLEIAFWISDYLQSEYREDRLSSYQMNDLQRLVNLLVDMLGACERILRTPIPLAYAIHLRQLLLIYCLILPFHLVEDLKWSTVPIVGLISFTLFGIEAIGEEIENPFGTDPNDLPLDNICQTINRNVEELIYNQKPEI
jgi:putative membrane protein